MKALWIFLLSLVFLSAPLLADQCSGIAKDKCKVPCEYQAPDCKFVCSSVTVNNGGKDVCEKAGCAWSAQGDLSECKKK